MKKAFSIIGGFTLLFLLYHLPEFFQRYYHAPLLWLLESGMLAMVIVSYWVMRWQERQGYKAYGLVQFRKNKSNLFWGGVIGIVLSASANLLTVILHWNSLSVPFGAAAMLSQTALFIIGTFLPSLAEDILTRGYLFAHMPAGENKSLFVLVSAIIFTLNHIFRLADADVMVYIFILGLMLAWCLVYTGSLWLTLGIHWGTNIAYQYFTNIASLRTVKETGLDNYVLAAVYLAGWFLVMWLYRNNAFRHQRTVTGNGDVMAPDDK